MSGRQERHEDYYRMRSIFEPFDELYLHQKQGGHFKFPIYVNEQLKATDIEALELGARALHCLKRAGISTIGELCSRVSSSSDLQGIRNCGRSSIAEIMDSMFAYQYSVLSPEGKQEYLAEIVRINAPDYGD